MYPVMLDVREERCLVVGGGGVGLRKVDGLLAEGAIVTVVAKEPMAALERLAEEGRIQLERRCYETGEANRFALAFAATDDRTVNRRVYEDSRKAGVWVNVADDPDLCSFHLPARVQRGSLQLAIGSAGDAPFVVRRLRRVLERRFGPEWAEWQDAAARFRRRVRERKLSKAEQEARYDAFFEGTVDPDSLTARVPVPADVATYLSSPGSVADPGERTPAATSGTGQSGLVSLVGAGPGDAGLLTIRGRQRLLRADAVVYDRLAATALPTDLPARVELHCVGKQAQRHPVPQVEISALLLRLARRGLRVVRLKGGDPFVFGRGAEEAEHLARAGIRFEIVPCVTAGVAVPAYAGVPVTHRREAVRVSFLTAHEAIKSGGSLQRWDLLAADPHATIVGYMGVTVLSKVVANLLAAGMDPATPSVMIQQGTTSRQRSVRSPVAGLPDAVARANLTPPGLFVIGPTVRHAEHLDWFATRPLMGERLVLVAPGGDLGEELELLGAEIVELPLPVTPASRVVIDALPITGCVCRSVEELDSLDEERDRTGWDPGVVAWCGDAFVAERARELGWRSVKEFDSAESLLGIPG